MQLFIMPTNKMNLIQSFMTCMSPDATRTDSIESIDQDCKFEAANVDEQGNDISSGVLHITDEAIIYVILDKPPIIWPLDCIRRYGCLDLGQKLVFEAGRKCVTGQGIYAFRLYRAQECVDRLNEKIDSRKCRLDQETAGRIKDSNPKSPTTTAKTSKSSSKNQHKKDAATSTKDNEQPAPPTIDDIINDDCSVKPLSYVLIDFEQTNALHESALAHAATRVK